jgi:hypothetical protein
VKHRCQGHHCEGFCPGCRSPLACSAGAPCGADGRCCRSFAGHCRAAEQIIDKVTRGRASLAMHKVQSRISIDALITNRYAYGERRSEAKWTITRATSSAFALSFDAVSISIKIDRSRPLSRLLSRSTTTTSSSTRLSSRDRSQSSNLVESITRRRCACPQGGQQVARGSMPSCLTRRDALQIWLAEARIAAIYLGQPHPLGR